MKITQSSWTIEQLIEEKESINLNPFWQRGPAWKPPRQVLLIDSILRGMDIPKIYLRVLPASNSHTHDAVDGQQRLRAIWEFRAGTLALNHPEPLEPIGGVSIVGKTFDQLTPALRERFDQFEIIVAEITQASSDQVTTLFARLQMGLSLNPAELRNAMQSPLRHVIDTIAGLMNFFSRAKSATCGSRGRTTSLICFRSPIIKPRVTSKRPT